MSPSPGFMNPGHLRRTDNQIHYLSDRKEYDSPENLKSCALATQPRLAKFSVRTFPNLGCGSYGRLSCTSCKVKEEEYVFIFNQVQKNRHDVYFKGPLYFSCQYSETLEITCTVPLKLYVSKCKVCSVQIKISVSLHLPKSKNYFKYIYIYCLFNMNRFQLVLFFSGVQLVTITCLEKLRQENRGSVFETSSPGSKKR